MNAGKLLIAVVGLFSLAGAHVAPATDEAVNKLDGTWVVVAATNDDGPQPPEQFAKVKLTVASGKFKYQDGDFAVEGTIEVDPTKSPNAFDAVIPDGVLKSERILGIYKLEGDTWTMCFSVGVPDSPPAARPSDFQPVPESGIRIVWKRAR